MILTSTLIAFAAFALSASATVTPPPNLGINQAAIYGGLLQFSIWTDAHCKGTEYTNQAGYGEYIPVQMQSYSLSRDLEDFEKLDFYVGDGTGLNLHEATFGNTAVACQRYSVTAGINATTHDANGAGHGRHVGCHDLIALQWCANLWQPN